MSDKVKQVIVIRRDLNMRRGKEIAQGSHASNKWLVDRVNDILRDHPEMAKYFTKAEMEWLDDKWTKVTCQVDSEKALVDIFEESMGAHRVTKIIEDEGLTEFHQVKTLTAMAIGPDVSSNLDPITRKLKLY